jgi:hypothetical protein
MLSDSARFATHLGGAGGLLLERAVGAEVRQKVCRHLYISIVDSEGFDAYLGGAGGLLLESAVGAKLRQKGLEAAAHAPRVERRAARSHLLHLRGGLVRGKRWDVWFCGVLGSWWR